MAEVCGCLVVDKGICGAVGVKANAMSGSIGRCAGVVKEVAKYSMPWSLETRGTR